MTSLHPKCYQLVTVSTCVQSPSVSHRIASVSSVITKTSADLSRRHKGGASLAGGRGNPLSVMSYGCVTSPQVNIARQKQTDKLIARRGNGQRDRERKGGREIETAVAAATELAISLHTTHILIIFSSLSQRPAESILLLSKYPIKLHRVTDYRQALSTARFCRAQVN